MAFKGFFKLNVGWRSFAFWLLWCLFFSAQSTAIPSFSMAKVHSFSGRPAWEEREEDRFLVLGRFRHFLKDGEEERLKASIGFPAPSEATPLESFVLEPSEPLSLSKSSHFFCESRFYVPTEWETVFMQNLLSARAAFSVEKKFSKEWTLRVGTRSLAYFNGRSGYRTESGGRANRIFENRTHLSAEWQSPKGWALSLPIVWQQVRHANFHAEAKYNGRWRHLLWINPELYYYFDSDSYLSLSYESESLVYSDLKAMDLVGGLSEGAVQVTLRLAL